MHDIIKKILMKQHEKCKYTCSQFPKFWAENTRRRVDIPLKTINNQILIIENFFIFSYL